MSNAITASFTANSAASMSSPDKSLRALAMNVLAFVRRGAFFACLLTDTRADFGLGKSTRTSLHLIRSTLRLCGPGDGNDSFYAFQFGEQAVQLADAVDVDRERYNANVFIFF